MAIKKESLAPKADLLLEISWETCNKVGGINTVLATKAAQMVARYHDGYVLVGPYFEQNSRYQLEKITPPPRLEKIFGNLKAQGIICHFGRWLIDGEPQVILIDFSALWPNVNRYKKELWDDYQIDSLESGFDFDEPAVWGYAVARMVEQMRSEFSEKSVVIHCHEWLAGTALLFAKKFCQNIASVFTTHATTLGRSLAFAGRDLYNDIERIDSLKEAYNYRIQAKHLLEAAAAREASVFTTVSEITGVECRYFLQRMPDLFLPNGLDAAGYLSFEEAAIKHRIQRGRIREFVFYNFFPHYVFDLKNTIFYFMLARYEYRAKGIDLFIKALGEVNRRLKKDNSSKTIVSFLWIPTRTKGIDAQVSENRSHYFDIKEFVEENSGDLVETFMYSLFAGKNVCDADVFDEEPRRELSRRLKKMRRSGLPPICTHELEYRDDMILKGLSAAGLENKKEDRVKVIFYPAYLTGTDKLLNLNLREAIQGCHLGVFPSYYEPWGYTPLEAAAEGVPAVTGDLSGLGRFIKQNLPIDTAHPGIFIVENDGKSEQDAANQLSDILYDYAVMSRQDRVENKINARKMVNSFDWKNLVENYVAAHNLALKNSKLKIQN